MWRGIVACAVYAGCIIHEAVTEETDVVGLKCPLLSPSDGDALSFLLENVHFQGKEAMQELIEAVRKHNSAQSLRGADSLCAPLQRTPAMLQRTPVRLHGLRYRWRGHRCRGR